MPEFVINLLAWVLVFVVTITPAVASVSMVVCIHYGLLRGEKPPKRAVWSFAISFPLMLILLAWYSN